MDSEECDNAWERRHISISEKHQILIHSGTVIYGNNVPGVRADVLIEDDRIVRIGPVDSVIDAQKIDATGKVVAPGFIAPHNHANSEVKDGILKYPLADNLIRHGSKDRKSSHFIPHWCAFTELVGSDNARNTHKGYMDTP